MKTIVVLGMHRSATSLVARTLNKEVHMGKDLLIGLPDNPKGHYENVHIIKINDKILHQAGGAWYDPPPLENILSVAKNMEEEMREIIQKETLLCVEKGLESWGFKDPRTALTIEAWFPLLDDPHFVVCYRNPMDIARSLSNRNEFLSLSRSLELTKEYYKRINNFMERWLNDCVDNEV